MVIYMAKSNKPIYPVYEEELNELSYRPDGFFDRLLNFSLNKLTNPVKLPYSFFIPVSEYLRGELFCEDVSEAMGNYEFTQRDLISILVVDFLYQVKDRNNPYDLYHELKQRNDYFVKIYSYSEDKHKPLTFAKPNKTTKTKEIKCTLKRKVALRLEVMLSDITDVEPENEFVVEDILRLLYSDFIQQYKKGNLGNVIPSIIRRLNSE